MVNEDLLSRGSGLLANGAQERLKNVSIVVAGAGSIGSWLALALAKLGCENVSYYDNDLVEIANYSNQIYGLDEIDMHKCDALSKYMYSYNIITENWVYHKKFLSRTEPINAEIVVMAVDSIATREEIFANCKESDSVKLVLDGRIGRTIAAGYAIDMLESVERDYYQKREIFPSDEAAQIPCTEKTFIAPCQFISSYMSGALHAYVNNRLNKYPLKFYMDFQYMAPQITPRNHVLLLKSLI